MPDFRSLYDSNYIYSFDLKGRDVTVTVAKVVAGQLKGADGKTQRKPVLYFREAKDARGLALCKTNARTIAAMYGNDTDAWIGKRVTLYPTSCEAFGATVECIRIRPKTPAASAKPGQFAETPGVPTPEAPEHAEAWEPSAEEETAIREREKKEAEKDRRR